MFQDRVIILVGATASGKTAVAVELAKHLDGEIINADSRQVYRYLDIGTAKPTETEKQEISHYGFDIVDPSTWYSAGQYAKDARQWIQEIKARKKTPIVAGGSGLYLTALVDGFFGNDIKDSAVRKNLEAREHKDGLPSLYEELLAVDPKYGKKTQPNDRQRILRALEVYHSSGKRFSELHAGDRDPSPFHAEWIGLSWCRETLYERINQRVTNMLDRGLLEEVRSLLDRGYESSNALKSVGYEEIIAYFHGDIQILEEAAELIRRNTRHYAKRQLTWFNANDRITWFDCENKSLQQITGEILQHLR